MKYQELAEKLASRCRYPLEGTVIQRKGKPTPTGIKTINTFVLRAKTSPPRVFYRKNLRTEQGAFLAAEVPPRILENIEQKLAAC